MSIRNFLTTKTKDFGLQVLSDIAVATVKPITDRATSLVLDTVEVSDSLANTVMGYLIQHAIPLPLGQKRYDLIFAWVRPQEKDLFVVTEHQGKENTFWYRNALVFLNWDMGSQHRPQSYTISVFRGTLDIEALLADTAKYESSFHYDEKTTRFRVTTHYGRHQLHDSREETGDPQPRNSFVKPMLTKAYSSSSSSSSARYVSWDTKDIGLPIPEAPFSHLAYSPEIEDFKLSIHLWMKSRKWYSQRSIPWRMSGLLKGPPGSGKTSFARATAQDLGLPVHVFDLGSMSNSDLIEHWKISVAEAPCMVLFEDVDRIFDENKNIAHSSKNQAQGITLDCLLNCIDGVDTHDGVILIATANYADRLDSALTRPGRLDHHVYFGPLDASGREAVAARILKDFESYITEVVAAGEGETGAFFEKRCQDLALRLFWERERGITLSVLGDP